MNKKHNRDKKPKKGETFRALVNFSQTGITVIASVFVSVLLGKFLDQLLDTSPCLLLFFSLLGVGAAIKSLFNMKNDL